ncbi:MAG: hypothetical protein PHE09_09730 [Oscillospiraceae bacterium]|nr:hypothetical protein [Oscillospiraceae bacterium]
MTHEEYCIICSNTLDTLYRFTYLTLGDQDVACELVTKACVWGCNRRERFNDEADLEIRLVRWLFWHCQFKYVRYAPGTNGKNERQRALYTALSNISRLSRSILILRFCLGLKYHEVRRIVHLPQKVFDRFFMSAVSETAKYLKSS